MADYNTKKPNESKTAWRDEQGNYVYKYPHPALTADAVVFGFDGSQLNVLLIMRKYEPFEGYWALPGGFVRNDETVEEAVKRELREETNLQLSYMEQFHIYSSPDRDRAKGSLLWLFAPWYAATSAGCRVAMMRL